MDIEKAVEIYKNIESDEYSMPEKIEAIEAVMNAGTYNVVSKSDEFKVIKWALNKMVEEEMSNENNR